MSAPPMYFECGAPRERYPLLPRIGLRRGLFPGAKEIHETIAIARRKGVFAERSYSGDGSPHLLEVGAAPFAHRQMGLEARAISRAKHPFQVGGHGFDQLLACHIVVEHMPLSPLVQPHL